jgi:glutamyl-tRNA reductase
VRFTSQDSGLNCLAYFLRPAFPKLITYNNKDVLSLAVGSNLQNSPKKILAVGLDFERAPIGIRELVSIGPDDIFESLEKCHSLSGVEEVMILSTCNRTEIYALCADESTIVNWLADNANLDVDTLRRYIYVHYDDSAARHLFRVACGLESMALGETQIFGQLKDSFKYATQAGVIGRNLTRLCEFGFSVAKEVRSSL